MRLIRRILLWYLNATRIRTERNLYIYVRDFDGRYRIFCKQTFDMLPEYAQKIMTEHSK